MHGTLCSARAWQKQMVVARGLPMDQHPQWDPNTNIDLLAYRARPRRTAAATTARWTEHRIVCRSCCDSLWGPIQAKCGHAHLGDGDFVVEVSNELLTPAQQDTARVSCCTTASACARGVATLSLLKTCSSTSRCKNIFRSSKSRSCLFEGMPLSRRGARVILREAASMSWTRRVSSTRGTTLRLRFAPQGRRLQR